MLPKNIHGVYPTMITPYKNGNVDLDAVRKLVGWYREKGCDGIFAACQSSEIMFLSLEEKERIVKAVVGEVNRLAESDPEGVRMTVVASGHTSDSFDEQVSFVR